MRSALVIGGAGFIGSNLIKRLIVSGLIVTSFDNYSTGSESNHVHGARYIRGDARSDKDLKSAGAHDIVFHLGEYSRVEQSEREPINAINGICRTVYPVIQFCHQSKAKMIYSGSSTKFGDAQSAYSISKAINTKAVNDICSHIGVDYAITYFYNAYGPNEISFGAYATVVAKFLMAKRMGHPVTITAPGTQRRNFTHVDDIVSGLCLVARDGMGDGFGIGSDESWSIIDLAEKIGVDYKIGERHAANRSGASLVTEKTKMLGWRPVMSLGDYIGEQNATPTAPTN